jgi:flagellar protein FlgJ
MIDATQGTPATTSSPATPMAAKDPKQRAKLKEAAHAFEAVFLRQMISSMRSASLGSDILGSEASNQFRDMSDAKLADAMAQKGTLGVADMLMKQFMPRVAAAPDKAPPK